MPGPLSGIKILDLTTVVMGPFATQILAELGADVIKVETHDGDNMRHVGPMASPGMGHLYLNLNRGKRGIVLDLKQPQGREALLRMVSATDVLIYNVRPQAMARLGLAYADVQRGEPAHHLCGRLWILAARALRGEGRIRRLDPGCDGAGLARRPQRG